MLPERNDINAFLNVKSSVKWVGAIAGGLNDNTWVGGDYEIDRLAERSPQSCVAVGSALLALSAGKTATFNLKITHADESGGSYSDFSESSATVYDDSYNGAQVAPTFGVNLAGAKRYIKMMMKCDLSNTGTDTAILGGVIVFERGDRL